MVKPSDSKRGDEKMGSYDTDETYTPPSRGVRLSREINSDDQSRNVPVPQKFESEASTIQSTYNIGALLLVSLGGGLTPSRIVKKIPEEFAEKTISDVVEYMLSPSNLTSNEEIAIADAVSQRMRATDYRGIINNKFNYANNKLHEDILKTYLVGDERTNEQGTIKFNKADLAIVSHDEGGRKYYTIDKLLK
jgi:hypothetical protein